MWVLGCTTNFFLIHRKIENWHLLMLLQFDFSVLSDSRKRWNIWIFECYLRLYFQVSLKQIKRLEIRFLNSTYFHTLSDCVRTVFQAWYVFMRESEFVVKLPVFQIKKKKEMFIFMEKICVSISAGNTVSKCKISLVILMQIFNRFLMRV